MIAVIILIAAALAAFQFYRDLELLTGEQIDMGEALREMHRIQGDMIKSMQQLAIEVDQNLVGFDKRIKELEK